MLELSGLVAGYGRRALAKLGHLQVKDGEAALLTGPSGAGKTTLLLAIAGLADVLEGHVQVAGRDMATLPARERDRHRGRHIGTIFQDLHLVPGLSALDNLLLAPFASGQRQDRARATELLTRLGLADRVHAGAETLSRGEAQRTAIARAMLIGPSLILADEPTASLDDESCETVLALLLDATRESGAALVIATHDSRVKARVSNIALVVAA
ncbi:MULTISPECIES: ABC transporter ATP-binding protein [Sphingobium]|uniref:ABC-type transport system ATPase component n=1 Tax=Sphingobium indicum (strain DSM 16413 / CCM 7287 / MTCC 6362 / UT26 / NBRC 101211 / UT26S) TaxID=452662 RepID=D4Z2A0_SPHIU|nr:ATP-binding cassette domain-containing protein [Sphingobium indicum]BAI96732.1 ABC-type transport system ATPase component [Sphingobium indicum UT26S]